MLSYCLNVDNSPSLLLLKFVDDIVWIADSITRKKSQFWKCSLLENGQKSKILNFLLGGYGKLNLCLTNKDEELEIVSKFTYHGIPFSNRTLFLKFEEYFTSKIKQAVSVLLAVKN